MINGFLQSDLKFDSNFYNGGFDNILLLWQVYEILDMVGAHGWLIADVLGP